MWAVYPEQFDPTKPFELVVDRIPDSGGRSLAERVSAKLGREDQLVTDFGAPILGATSHHEFGALWRYAGEITVGELWGYFTRHTYLPRVVRCEVLVSVMEKSLSAVLVDNERFAIASGKDTDTGRYCGLRVAPNPNTRIPVTDSTLLIETEHVQKQVDADRIAAIREAAMNAATIDGDSAAVVPVDFVWTGSSSAEGDEPSEAESAFEAVLARFFGSVKIDSDRYACDIGNVTREVIDRLAGAGARLDITIDIQVTNPGGFDESEVRTIGENVRVLKFGPSSGFEKI